MKLLVRHRLLLAAVLSYAEATSDAVASGAWVTLDQCHFVADTRNDGDSFHVRAGTNEYIFRLYFVDAPETNPGLRERLDEQAKYFGVTPEQALKVGETAKKFAEETLQKPFKVHTRMQRVIGRSETPRFYGFVETRTGDLGEQLVVNGLARAHGTEVAAPDGLEKPEVESERLWELEREAKRAHRGGWGNAKRPLRVRIFERVREWSQGWFKQFAKPKLDVNVASEAELEALPGVGKVIAQRIIADRPFESADDLRHVKGVGAKKYAALRPYFR